MTTTVPVPSATQHDAPLTDRRWSSGHIPVLDGLRGCAVLSVMFYHFLSLSPQGTGWALKIRQVFEVGWCGVDLFFVLSGFLITGILLDAKGSPNYFKSFYVRRVLRIFPLYYGVILLVSILRHSHRITEWFHFGDIRASMAWMWAYLCNFYMAYKRDKTAFGPMGHFWSLAIEEHFYLVWPALIFACTRRRLAIVCCLFVVGALLLRCALVAATGAVHSQNSTYMLTPCRVDGLALGALLALIVRSSINVNRVRAWAWGLGIISVVMVVAVGIKRGGFSHYGVAMSTIGYTLFAVIFTSMIALLLSARPTSPARRALEFAPLISVGRYSFAMYILHLLCMRPFTLIFPISGMTHLLHSKNLSIIIFSLLAALTTYAMAWLSWNLYEKNFLKLKRLFPY